MRRPFEDKMVEYQQLVDFTIHKHIFLNLSESLISSSVKREKGTVKFRLLVVCELSFQPSIWNIGKYRTV